MRQMRVAIPIPDLAGWLDNALPCGEWADSQPAGNTAFAESIQAAIREGYQVKGIQVQIGVPPPGKEVTTQLAITPWQ